MKILVLSDGGCTTGFGRVVHSIFERMVRDYGHEVHVLAVNHRGDDFMSLLDPTQKTPLRLYMPNKVKGDDIYGTTRILELLGSVQPDVVFSLNDPQVILQLLFENQYDPRRDLLQYRPITSYIPCDGINLPPEWAEKLGKVARVVTMSKWGQAQYPGSEMVYHGVDVEQWWPVAEKPIAVSTGAVLKTKKDCKEAFGFDPKGFLVGRIDSNSGRKDFPATWKALVPVMKRHKDIQVHFHCSASNAQSGVRLQAMFSREPAIADRFFVPDLHSSFIGWAQRDMNALMNAFDLFVSTSRGEGFGLSLAEAAACAIPVVAQNVSAIPEVVGGGGVLIEPQRLITVPSGEDNWLADIDAFSDAIEHLYESRGARRDIGQKGVAHARKNLNWDVATKAFNGFFEEDHAKFNEMMEERRIAVAALAAQGQPENV